MAGDLAIKADKVANHRRTVDDLIGFSRAWNNQCATAIANNVVIQKKQIDNKMWYNCGE